MSKWVACTVVEQPKGLVKLYRNLRILNGLRNFKVEELKTREGSVFFF